MSRGHISVAGDGPLVLRPETAARPSGADDHGASSNHRLNLRRVFGFRNKPGETDVEATRYFPEWEDIDFIVASPYARGAMGYEGVPEQDGYDVQADVKSASTSAP